MEQPQGVKWKNSLNQSGCRSSFSATQVDSLTPAQEAVVAVFRFAEHWTFRLLQCSLAALLSGAVCVSECVRINGPEASIGVAACPTAYVCWMDKSTYNPLGLAAGSSHGPFLFLSSLCPLFLFLTSFSLLPSLFPIQVTFQHFLVLPTKELAITSVVGNLLPAFQYTHRHTFAHSSAYIFAQSLPFFISQCKQTENIYRAHRLHIALCPGRRDLKCLKLTLRVPPLREKT